MVAPPRAYSAASSGDIAIPRERRFPSRLAELDARGDHAALVPQAGFGRRFSTDISAQDLLDVVSCEPLGWPFYG
jgi:hypothetical protein